MNLDLYDQFLENLLKVYVRTETLIEK